MGLCGQVLLVGAIPGANGDERPGRELLIGLGEREDGEIGEGSYRPLDERLGMLVINRRRFGGCSIWL